MVLPIGDDRAMVTVDPGVRSSAADVAALAPRAVAVNLDLLYVVPDGAAAYVTCGDDDARAFAGRPPAKLSAARALFVSEGEALVLSGADELDAAIRMLGDIVPTVVVTLGARGAVASVEGRAGGGHDGARLMPYRWWTPPAPATCWWPPTSGPISWGSRPPIGCGGP